MKHVSNSTYLCFGCRTTVRREDYSRWPKCSHCGKDMVGIGKHWRAPKQTNMKAWKELQEKIEEIIRRRKLEPPYNIHL